MLKFSRLVTIYSPNSSRALQYFQRTQPKLQRLARARGATFYEIALDDLPLLDSVELITRQIRDHDLVIAAGGDGINQVALQAVFESERDVVAGFLPLGNGNDFATALNGRAKNPARILASPTIDFHPLELAINHQPKFYVAAYATFGITTVAVDLLNSNENRTGRRRQSRLSPIAALKPRQLTQLSCQINTLDFPAFRRDGQICHDDSVGFFLVPAAKNLLRPAGGVSNFLSRDDFFFHSDNVCVKSPGQGWLGKSFTAAAWATRGLPGVISDDEQLEFLRPSDLTINIGGDTIVLEQVQTISAVRAERSVKILAARRSLQT